MSRQRVIMRVIENWKSFHDMQCLEREKSKDKRQNVWRDKRQRQKSKGFTICNIVWREKSLAQYFDNLFLFSSKHYIVYLMS